ncbi:MAG: hypothetical protein QM627_07055 [Luteolibacter sp.]
MVRTLSLLASFCLGITTATAAISYHETSFVWFNQINSLDLDGDGTNDITIDFNPSGLVGVPNDFENNPFIITPLGSALIASTGGIADSFSVGSLVDVNALSYVGSTDSTYAGGLVGTIFGYFIQEGWGYVADSFTGEMISPVKHHVDLFIVVLDSGVAWVDFTLPADVWNIPLQWGYSTETSPFIITAVPEASSFLLIMATSAFMSFRRKRTA